MSVNIEVLSHQDSLYEIANKQWELLDALEAKYVNVDMSNILREGQFLDPIWFLKDASSIKSINFKTLFPNREQYPLELICRVVCYQLSTFQGVATETNFARLRAFVNQIVNSGQWDNIMCAERNQPFTMFSAIESEVITNITQTRLVVNGGISNGAFDFLNKVYHLKDIEDLNVFILGITLPWVEQGIGVNEWLEQQREVTGVIKENSFYAPMPFENVSSLVQNALPIIDSSAELLEFFGEFGSLLNDFGNPHRAKNSKRAKLTIEKYKEVISPILPIEYAHHTVNEDFIPVKGKWITNFFNLTKSACIWIILLSTGLRNIDMRNLRIGCCQPSKRYEGIWWLVADVQKTKNRLVIPVGEPTYKAVKLLEAIRFSHEGGFLISSSKHIASKKSWGRQLNAGELGKTQHGTTLNDLLKILPSTYNFSISTIAENDSEATAHCIRATLAGYISQNTNAAILILKRLFGHSNALMPNEYIYRNPLVVKKRKELQTKLCEDMAKDMAFAVTYGQVGGRNGERLLKGAKSIKSEIERESQLNNQSLTEMELFQTLEERLTELYLDDMKNGETYSLLTPMAVICNRACNNTSDSPCAAQINRQERIASGIKKAITNALSTLPNPSQCVGASCSDALLGKKWSRKLLEDFDFYYKYRNVAEPQSAIEEDAIAFINMYAEPLKSIYSDEREKGYFDVAK
jgi:integrase